MTVPLDPEWFDAVTAALAEPGGSDPVGEPEASAEVEIVVTGVDAGSLVTRWTIAGGRLVSVRVAEAGAEPADVSATQSAADLGAVVDGELDPAVAFMRGDLKPEGSAAAWFAFVSAMNQPSARAALAS